MLERGVIRLVRVALTLFVISIVAIPGNAWSYNKSWDQGHKCVNPSGGLDGWGRYDYAGVFKGGYSSKNCCEVHCKVCPVYANTGRLEKSFTDLEVPGIGPSLTITRTYLSQDIADTLLGRGWMFNFGKRLIIARNNDAERIIGVRQEKGEKNFFKEHLDGTLELLSDFGIAYKLTKNTDNTYTIKELNGSTQLINTDGKTIKIIDKNGNELLFAYDAVGCLSRITNASGNYIDFQLGVNGKIASISDNFGRTVSYNYDVNGNLNSSIDPMGNTTQYSYDSQNRLIQINDPRGNPILSVTYDGFQPHRIATLTEKGETWTITYYSDHTDKRDSSGNTWTYYFNESGIIERVIDPLGNTTQQHHNHVTATSMEWEEDANGNRTSYTYDADGNIASKTDPLGNIWQYTYIAGTDQIVTETDPSGIVTQYEYDSYGNLVRLVRDSDGLLENAYTYTYDFQGNQTSATDPLGYTTYYEYDTTGNQIKITDPVGNVTSYTYDNKGNRISETDSLGNTIFYSYDMMGRLLSVTDAHSNTSTYIYDRNGNRRSETNADGNSTTYTYDAWNRLIQITDAMGNTISYTYDYRDNLTSMTDANGNSTTYAYDIIDRLIRETNGLGGQTNYVCDGAGNILRITDACGNIKTFTYDAKNRKTSETNAAGETTTYVYDAIDNLLETSLPNGNTISRVYDALGRLTTVSDTLGPIGGHTYDLADRQTSTVDALGNTTAYVFNGNGWLVRTTDPLGNNKVYTYDALGRTVAITDREGNVVGYAYDAVGRRVSQTDQLGNVTTYSYDNLGNLLSVTDTLGNTTSYSYDALNRLIQEIYADSTTRSYTYDGVGNVTSRTDQKGMTTAYLYDALNQRVKVDYPGTNDDVYTYDCTGNLSTANNANATVSLTYDNIYRLIQSVQNGEIVAYSHNTVGGKTTITYPGGKVVKNVRNLRRLLTSVENASGQPIVQYAYDAADRLQAKTYLNGVVGSYTHNANGWTTQLSYESRGTQGLGFQYGLDRVGNRLYTRMLHDTGNSEQYIYDAKYRLTRFRRGTIDAGGNVTTQVTQTAYNLDALANWTSKTTDGVTENRTYNNMNELIGINGSHLTYDDNGNLTDDGTNTYEYDYDNRLVRVTRTSDSTVQGEYEYDALGRRIQENVGASTTTYYYDNERVLEERSGGIVTATYVYGSLLDEVLVMERGGNSYYYLPDALGSVRGLSDVSAVILETYNYDPYGKPSVFEDTGSQLSSSAVGNPYLFTGRSYNFGTTLQYNRRRYCHPQYGRWVSRDPIGYIDSLNLYEYVLSNPVNLVDPLGLRFIDLGKTGTSALHGYGGTGGSGNQNCGSYTAVSPQYEWQPCKCWVKVGTGTVTVTRSFTGVPAGQQGSSGKAATTYVTARAAAYIDVHEQDHIDESRRIHDLTIKPMEQRIANHFGSTNCLRHGVSKQQCIDKLKNIIKWNQTLNSFSSQDTSANCPGGTIDQGVGVTDYGQKSVGGTVYLHYIDL